MNNGIGGQQPSTETGGKIEGKEGIKGGSSEAGTATDIATTISVAEEANTFSVGANKACSDKGSQKDKCSDSKGTGAEDWGTSQKRPLCYGSRSGKKLLFLQRIWAHGPPL